MSKHLLALSIGPVQGFIAAARRTRDLWCGSLILSEISKVAAKAVADVSGLLIFPALAKNAPELQPYPASIFNVANIILAELPEGIIPSEVANKAEKAAQSHWLRMAETAKDEAKDFIEVHRWTQQVEDVIEFYASWCPLDPDAYGASRQRVMRLMAARKACRDFAAERGYYRVPKSSLDGARDTLWKDPDEVLSLNRKMERRLRLCRGEHLDAVGLAKRLAYGVRPYPSVSRIAADPWLRGLHLAAKRHSRTWEVLESVSNLCEQLTKYGLGRVDKKIFPEFPYEGTAVYANRHHELKEEMGNDQQVASLVDDLTRQITALVKMRRLEDPDPYLAVLAADGDRMGKIISGINNVDRHRDFSRRLALFAGQARDIVEEDRGCLVYSGGDDVLAFVPVDKCLACAQRLHEAFSKLLEPFKTRQGDSPTLSVGIAIGHFMESLENLLEYGRRAERAAKHPDRNGLAIHVRTRGGAPLEVRGTWEENSFIERLNLWKTFHLEERISHGTAYDIRTLALNYAGRPYDERAAPAIRAELHRLLTKKSPSGKRPLEESVIDQLMALTAVPTAGQQGAAVHYHPEVMRLAKELLVSRRIARAERQAGAIPVTVRPGNGQKSR